MGRPIDFSPFEADLDPAEARRLADGFPAPAGLSVAIAVVAVLGALAWPAWVFMHLPTAAAWLVYVGSLVGLALLLVGVRRRERRRSWHAAARLVLFARANGFVAHPPGPARDVADLPDDVLPGWARNGRVTFRLTGTYRDRAFQIGQLDATEESPHVFLHVPADRPSLPPEVDAAAAAARLRVWETDDAVIGTSTWGRNPYDVAEWRRLLALLDAVDDALDRRRQHPTR